MSDVISLLSNLGTVFADMKADIAANGSAIAAFGSVVGADTGAITAMGSQLAAVGAQLANRGTVSAPGTVSASPTTTGTVSVAPTTVAVPARGWGAYWVRKARFRIAFRMPVVVHRNRQRRSPG